MEGIVVRVEMSFGWIEPLDPTQEQIFYHKSSLLDGRKRLIVGEHVEYEISEYRGKPVAINVRVTKSLASDGVAVGGGK